MYETKQELYDYIDYLVNEAEYKGKLTSCEVERELNWANKKLSEL